ncbi:MAG: Wzz/FepE/Etk N-terminal domain-containing protein, partial [Flammeovirgaceae bacterium]|nr:Wzz/FepE/Etk N-terminal domain-containing protein [Flammeovirgaceae bacterium]
IQPFEDKGSEINIDKILFIIKKRLIYLLTILIVGVTGSFLYLRYTKPIYEATAQIKLDYKTSSKIINIDLPFTGEGGADYLAGEIQIIKSNPIYQAVLDSLELRISYFAEGDIIDSELYQAAPFRVVLMNEDKKNFSDRKINIHLLGNNEFKIPFQSNVKEVYTFDEVIELNQLRFKVISLKPEATGKFYFTINSDATLLNYIAKNLSVTVFNPQSNTINISFTDNNPAKAVDIIRALIKAYYVKSIEKKNRAFEQALSYLDKQIEATKDSLDSFERQLQNLLKRGKTKPLQEEISMKFSKISELENKKIELKIAYENYDKLEKLVPQDTSFIYLSALATLTGNSSLQDYIKSMIASKSEYDRIQSYYKPTTFSRQQRLEEVKNQKARLLELIRFHKALIAERIRENDENLENLRSTIYTGGDEENTEAKKIAKNYSIYERLSSLMLEKYVEINIAKSSTVADFQIISHPYSSKMPIFPKPAIAYAVGLGIAAAICVWYVVLVYVLDNKVNSIKDIDRRTNLPILGLLPYIKEERIAESSKLIIYVNPKSAISEAFRSIRTNLDFIGINQKKKIISVTSTVSGEGKTFIAVNLGGIIAVSDVKVVVI